MASPKVMPNKDKGMLRVPFMGFVLISRWNAGSCNGARCGNSQSLYPGSFRSHVSHSVDRCSSISRLRLQCVLLLCSMLQFKGEKELVPFMMSGIWYPSCFRASIPLYSPRCVYSVQKNLEGTHTCHAPRWPSLARIVGGGKANCPLHTPLSDHIMVSKHIYIKEKEERVTTVKKGMMV